MKKIPGIIILVDNGIYEKLLIEIALKEMNWSAKIEYFSYPDKALDFLKNTKEEIFFILAELNMPIISGLDFKKMIDSDAQLRTKAIPFIFTSTYPTREQVTEAYNYGVQGYFKKPILIKEQAEMLDIIIQYWIICLHPNKKSDLNILL